MDEPKIKKENRRKAQDAARKRMPMNGVALKRLLIERAAKAQALKA